MSVQSLASHLTQLKELHPEPQLDNFCQTHSSLFVVSYNDRMETEATRIFNQLKAAATSKEPKTIIKIPRATPCDHGEAVAVVRYFQHNLGLRITNEKPGHYSKIEGSKDEGAHSAFCPTQDCEEIELTVDFQAYNPFTE